MVEIIFTKGLPGSGKSTWSLKYCQDNHGWVRINRDDLRLMRGTYWIPEQEGLITAWEREMVKLALLGGFNVIVDAMNINIKYCLAWTKYIHELMRDYNLDIKVSEKVFDTPLNICIERDAQRPKDRRVGAKIIREQYYKNLANVEPVVYNASLPHAIIVDIDGTVAINWGRDHYDYKTVGKDLPNQKVIDIIEIYLRTYNREVVFMSGRDDICIIDTCQWIQKYIPGLTPQNHTLIMRKTGDRRADNIVKRELFESRVRGKYNIDFVLDDRNQVVDMWRNELKLTCLQVAEGDF